MAAAVIYELVPVRGRSVRVYPKIEPLALFRVEVDAAAADAYPALLDATASVLARPEFSEWYPTTIAFEWDEDTDRFVANVQVADSRGRLPNEVRWPWRDR